MNRGFNSGDKSQPGCGRVGRSVITTLFLLLAVGLAVQAQSGSLADAARQARSQKQAQPQAGSNRAQTVADQLSEEQNSSDAPGGFKTFTTGDYKVWVPAPFSMDGRESGGTVLTGPQVGRTRTMVLVGIPIVFPWKENDAAFHDAAVHFAGMYVATPKCTKVTISNHEAYQCGMAAASLMGKEVSGNATLVRISGNLYPVLCAAPTDSRERDILNDPHSSYTDKLYARAELNRQEQDVRNVWQKCETVFQSIRVKEDVRQTAQSTTGDSTASAAGKETEPGGATPSTSAVETANAAGPGSLADVARRLKQDPAQAVSAPPPPANPAPAQTTVPAGFKAHAFQYCSGPKQCWDASVLVPVDAQLTSSDCRQYAFEVKVQGSPFVLMAGSAGSDCDNHGGPALIHWHSLVDPETKRAPGTYSTISSQVTKLDGKTATITTLGFRKGLTDWMGKRAEVDSNGVQIVVGCLAPRDHFADGDAVCSALIGSLQLP